MMRTENEYMNRYTAIREIWITAPFTYIVKITGNNINLTDSNVEVSFLSSSSLSDLQMLLLNPYSHLLR